MIEFKGIEFPPDFEGNVQKAFATRQNALDAKVIALMEDYASLLDFVKAQTAAATERRNTLLKKYQPNRAQKRAAEKKIRKTK